MIENASLSKVRIDKWLWAARFFKTRSLAKQAIEGGKVHVDGQRVKASKDLTIGLVLQIRPGSDERAGRVTDVLHEPEHKPSVPDCRRCAHRLPWPA